MPHETAAVSAQVLCTPYNHAPCHFMQSHIRKVYACLAVTCHLHFWQNDRELLRATAVTRGGTDSEIRVSTESRIWRMKFSRLFCRDSNPRPFSHESGALTTELFPPNDWSFETYFMHPKNSTQSFRLLVRVPPPPLFFPFSSSLFPPSPSLTLLYKH